MTIGGVVMAHRQREEWAEELSSHLALPIVWDRVNDRHETGLRCLEAGIGSGVSHWLVVQDDAIVCRDFLAGLTEAVKVSQERVVGLYVGNWRREAQAVTIGVRDARRTFSPWLEMPGPWWGVGIVVPVVHLLELTAHFRASTVQNYDRRIERWVTAAGVGCWYTMPSLVEHRTGPENPSLVIGEGRTSLTRRAQWFLGDRSALSIDWTKPAIRPGAHAVWRNTLTGRVLRVRPGSMQAVRLSASGAWAPVPEDDPAATDAQLIGRVSPGGPRSRDMIATTAEVAGT